MPSPSFPPAGVPAVMPVWRTAVLLLACGTLTTCGVESDADRGDAAPQATALTPGGATEVPPAGPQHFDPGSLAVGDVVLGVRVVDLDVRRVFEDSVWAGYVRFAGELALTGVFQQHFDYPEPAELCLHVDNAASVRRVPAFAPDTWTAPNRKSWFCFTNNDAVRERLGTGEPPLRATIIVDDYTARREFSDVFDTARLVDVVAIAGPASPTLREP
jgi:hypothetical protein